MTKKQFTEIICKTFNLKGITPSSFVFVINCILIGLVIVKIPGRKAYKLYLTIFPLWKSTLKECIEIPMYQQVIVNTKKMDLYIPENMTEEDINAILHQFILQIPFFPAKNISLNDFMKFLYDKTIADSTISGNFVLKMKLYKLIYSIALICKDYNSAAKINQIISQNINQWDDGIFQYWFGDKQALLKSLQEYESNRNNLQINVQNNLLNKKIIKLPKFNFSD